MRRKIVNGLLGGLVTLATLYIFGAVGLLIERMSGRSAPNTAIAFIGLAAALTLGVLFLIRLSRLTNISSK